MNITVACLASRREDERYLPSLREAWADFADLEAVLYDEEDDMWGSEVEWRSELWLAAVDSEADWIFVLDADMIPLSNPRSLFEDAPNDITAIAFRLYDLWGTNPYVYRSDGYWQAHQVVRVWAVRNPGPEFQPEWPTAGIHCGHFPSNLNTERTLTAPQEFSLLHYAYADEADRIAKYKQYLNQMEQLDQFQLQHALSIVQPAKVVPLPFEPEYDINKCQSTS